LALVYGLASAYSILQTLLTTLNTAGLVVALALMLAQALLTLLVISALLVPTGREYLLGLGLVLLQVLAGIVLAWWQSPAFWAAIAVLLFLLRPSIWNHFGRMGLSELRHDAARYRARHPRHRA
jgi:hypothetical protein